MSPPCAPSATAAERAAAEPVCCAVWQLRRAMLTWYCAKGSRHIDGKELALPCQNFLFTPGSWYEGGLRTAMVAQLPAWEASHSTV